MTCITLASPLTHLTLHAFRFDYFNKTYVEQPDLRRSHWEAVFQISIQRFPANPRLLVRGGCLLEAAASTTAHHYHARNRTADSVLVDIDGCEDQAPWGTSFNWTSPVCGVRSDADATCTVDSGEVRLLINDQRRSSERIERSKRADNGVASSVRQNADRSAYKVDLSAGDGLCREPLTAAVKKLDRSVAQRLGELFMDWRMTSLFGWAPTKLLE
jgi:hypothetical protein